MHCVMRAGNADAALELQKRRGNVNLPRKTDWKTPMDLAFGHDEVGNLGCRHRPGRNLHALVRPLLSSTANRRGCGPWALP